MAVDAPEPAGPPDVPGVDVLIDEPSVELIRDLLHEVIDPELGIDIVELGLLRDVVISGESIFVRFTVTTPACPLSSYIEDEIRACLWQLPAITQIDVECVYDPPWRPEDMSDAARAALGWS